jgi:hypothetical protein
MRATAELVVAAGERNIRVVVTTAPDLRVVRKVPCPAQPVLADFIDAVAQVVTPFRGDMNHAARGTWVLCGVGDGVHSFTNEIEAAAFTIVSDEQERSPIRFDNHGSNATVGG